MPMADRIQARARAIVAECSEQLPAAAEAFEAELLVVLNVQGTRETPSRPGEAPRRQSGRMWKSVEVVPEPRAGVVYVGPTVRYARILLGRNRPFYRITADRVRQRMADIVFGEARSSAGKPPRRSLGARISSFFSRSR